MKKFTDKTGSDLFLRSTSGIEQFHNQVKKNALSNSATFSLNDLSSTMSPQLVRKYLRFLYAQYENKYAELTGGLIDAINAKNYLLFALCGRSLLEITAILRYYTNKLVTVLTEANEAGMLDQEQQRRMLNILDSHARGGRFNWNEFHFGERSRFAAYLVQKRKQKDKLNSDGASNTILEKINPEQVNILTAIDQWAKEEPGVLLIYEFFCELVHPNLGSNFLVMGSKRSELIIGKSSPKDIARSLCAEGITMIAASAIREGAMQMAALLLLSETKETDQPHISSH